VSHDGTASSLRNRAMLVLLARLGRRAPDVVSLCRDESAWAAGCFARRPGKSRQARSLPLPHDVGQAVVTDRHGGRPRRAYRQVCWRRRPPFRSLTRRAVGAIVRHALTPAGLVVPSGVASHLFRHTVASAMGNHGASGKDVADVLGPPSLQTTGIDAPLAREAWAAVARPWGGGAQGLPLG